MTAPADGDDMAIDCEPLDFDDPWPYENGFYLTSHPSRIGKLLAHYELYKRIVDLPGHIVECGVLKGASLVRFATFRQLLESPHSRRIIAFDAFGKFPTTGDSGDDGFIANFEAVAGPGFSVDELQAVLRHKQFADIELVAGDIVVTVPRYVDEHPELKIALLHLDVDVYRPTQVVLERLYDRLVSGGLLVLDDYGTVAGETRAVDEFFRDRGATVRKLPLAHIPAFVCKP